MFPSILSYNVMGEVNCHFWWNVTCSAAAALTDCWYIALVTKILLKSRVIYAMHRLSHSIYFTHHSVLKLRMYLCTTSGQRNWTWCLMRCCLNIQNTFYVIHTLTLSLYSEKGYPRSSMGLSNRLCSLSLLFCSLRWWWETCIDFLLRGSVWFPEFEHVIKIAGNKI